MLAPRLRGVLAGLAALSGLAGLGAGCDLGLDPADIRKPDAGGQGGSGGGGATTTTTSGGSVCGDVHCDADETCGSCPEDCGCPAAQGCVADACVPCSATWRTRPMTLATVTHVALDDAGSLFAAGTSTDALVWAGKLATCNGTLVAEATLPGSGTAATGNALALDGDQVLVAGSYQTATPGDSVGVVAGFDAKALGFAWVHEGTGTAGVDDVSDVAAGPLGWIATGTQDVGGAAQAPWALLGTATGDACELTPPSLVQGAAGRVVVTTTDGFLGALAEGSSARLVRTGAACVYSAACTCDTSSADITFQVGAAATDPRRIVVVGSHAYVAGFAVDAADYYAFVADVDLVAGSLAGLYTYNPTPQLDLFFGIATDGTNLYVAGEHGWDGSASFATAVSDLIALPLTLAADTAPLWAVTVSGAYAAWSVAAEPGNTGGVYVSVDEAAGASIARCNKQGVCPF